MTAATAPARPHAVGTTAGAPAATPAGPASGRGDPPLSLAQEDAWLDGQARSGIASVLWLEGPLAIDRLERAVTALVARHEVLRSAFRQGTGPGPRRLPPWRVRLAPALDLTGLAADLRRAAVSGIAGQLRDRIGDPTRGPLVGFTLLRLARRRHGLLIVGHRLVLDRWSTAILVRELDALYRGADLAPPPGPGYGELARRQRRAERAGALDASLRHLRATPDQAPPVLDLTRHRLRPAVRTGDCAAVGAALDTALARRLTRFACQARTTAGAVLLAALAVVCSRYVQRDDLVFGVEVEARPAADAEGVVGPFTNVVPLRLRPHPSRGFGEFVRAVTDAGLVAEAHQYVPFPALVRALAGTPEAGCPPVVQVAFRHDRMPGPLRVGELRANLEPVSDQWSRFDLRVQAWTEPGAARLEITYDLALYAEPTVRRLLRHVRNLLAGALTDPDVRLADLPMLTVAERAAAFGEPPPPGGSSPSVSLVLDPDGMLAPDGVAGRVVTVQPSFVTMIGDRVVPRPGLPTPAATSALGVRTGGELAVLGDAARFPLVDGMLVPLDRVEAELAVHPGVRAVRVEVCPDGRLVAAVTPAPFGGGPPLDQHVRERLAAYARPQVTSPGNGRGTMPGTEPAGWPSGPAIRSDPVTGVIRHDAAGGPLSGAQARAWVEEQAGAVRPTTGVWDVTGPVHANALGRAFRHAVERHEALRSVLWFDPPVVRRRPAAGPELRRHDVRCLPPPVALQEADRLAREMAGRRFDLTREPPVRAALVWIREGHHRLIIVVHPVAADADDLALLRREIADASSARLVGYRRVPAGRRPP